MGAFGGRFCAKYIFQAVKHKSTLDEMDPSEQKTQHVERSEIQNSLRQTTIMDHFAPTTESEYYENANSAAKRADMHIRAYESAKGSRRAKVSLKNLLVRRIHKNSPSYTKCTLRGLSETQLQKIAAEEVPEHDVEDEYRWIRLIEQSPLSKFSKDQLLDAVKDTGTCGASNLSMVDAIDHLMNYEGEFHPRILNLDGDQLNAIQTVLGDNQKTIIYGNPGSGKTTTLAKIQQEYMARLDNRGRILTLSFNRNSEKVMKNRLRKLGVPRDLLADRKKIKQVNHVSGKMRPGIYVMTLHKYAARRSNFDAYGSNASFSHDRAFETSLAKGAQCWESNFDMVVVDEMQDITTTQIELVNQIIQCNSDAKVVYAGDPRQELYENTGYMSQYWLEFEEMGLVPCVLRYNHRSAPELVDFFNAFSREIFGDLHVDMIATRPRGGGTITASVNKKRADCVEDVTNALLGPNGVGSGVLISPVSISKYKMYDKKTEETVLSVRQNLYDKSGGRVYAKLMSDSSEMCDPPVVNVGNAMNVKGAEAESVCLIQSDVDYSNINISEDRYKRLLFVSITRARDNLHFALSRDLRMDGPLRCLSEFVEIAQNDTPPKFRKPKIYENIELKDHVAKPGLFSTNVIDEAQVTPIEVVCQKASDYLGALVESQCAHAMGFRMPKAHEYEFDVYNSSIVDEPVLYCHEDAIKVRVPEKCTEFMERLRERAYAIEDDVQRCANIKWSVRAGSVFTIADDTHQFLPVINRSATEFANIIGNASSHCNRIDLPMYGDRSNKLIVNVAGVTDIETDRYVIEVKHARSSEVQVGNRQAAIYAALLDKEAIVYDSKSGVVSTIEVPPKDWALAYIRAAHGMRQAAMFRSKIGGRVPIRTWPDLVIAVDNETSVGWQNMLLEVGAVACKRSNPRAPVGVFRRVADGVKCIDGSEYLKHKSSDTAEYYGFETSSMVNVTAGAEDKLRADFADWVAEMADQHGGGNCSIVQFGGKDYEMLHKPGVSDLSAYDSHDISSTFKVWMERNNVLRNTDKGLQNVMDQLTAGNASKLFVPHRAFEDAVALCMVTIMLMADNQIDSTKPVSAALLPENSVITGVQFDCEENKTDADKEADVFAAQQSTADPLPIVGEEGLPEWQGVQQVDRGTVSVRPRKKRRTV